MDSRKVVDIMLPLEEYATIERGCTIKEALVALNKAQLGLTYDRHQHRAVLVLDEIGKVVGKLTHWAILRSLEPELLGKDDLVSLGRAGLSSEFIDRMKEHTSMFAGNLSRMCRSAARVLVEDAMVPISDSIAEDAPLAEAIQRLVLFHEQSLLVHRQGRVVGILRLADVFEEVADLIREADTGTGNGF